MRTVLVTLAGFALLAMLLAVVPRPRRRAAAGGFIFLWLVVCAVDLGIGVLRAGYGLGEELAVHAVIFGLPAAAALWNVRRTP